MNKELNKKSFIKEHPIIFNALLILATFLIIGYISLFFIDIFTEHGDYKIVPNVKKLPLGEAVIKLESNGFRYEIVDSIYDSRLRPGDVAEQNPKQNARVKSNRVIYLSINAFSPKLVQFPNIKEVSVRQAQAMLQSLGIKNIRIENVFSPFSGLVIDAKMNGLSINAGTKIPVSSYITLQVGDGAEIPMPADSTINTEPDIDFGNDANNNDFNAE